MTGTLAGNPVGTPFGATIPFVAVPGKPGTYATATPLPDTRYFSTIESDLYDITAKVLSGQIDIRPKDDIPPHDIALFDLLQEECAEVIQARSKLRRGKDKLSARKPGKDASFPTNIQQVMAEVFDVLTIVGMLKDRGYFDEFDFVRHRKVKMVRIREHSPEVFPQIGNT